MNYAKRILAILLVLAMVTAMLPTAFAAKVIDDEMIENLQKGTVLTEADYALTDSLWEDINEMKESLSTQSATTEQTVEAVIALVEDSENYLEGSLERHEDCFTWKTTEGIACLYPYEEQQEDRGESIGDPIVPPESNYEFIDYRTKGAPDGADVYLIGPYYGVESNFTDHYKTVAKSVAEATGGTYTLYSYTNATIDNIAKAISNGAIVLVDSHGTTNTINGVTRSYLRLKTSTGITTADYNNGSAYYYNSAYMVNGTAIANHMLTDAPNSFVWYGICSGMAYNTMSIPLLERGVEACLGYSRTVSFHYDRNWLSSFCKSLIAGKTVAEAAATMKSEVGRWDRCDESSYNTLAKAISNNKAFPIIVSAEDSYPSDPEGLQTVNSTWRLYCGHSSIAKVAAKSATCTQTGCKEHYACVNCGACFADAAGKERIDVSTVTIAALGHNYVNSVCSRCGMVANVTMLHFWKGSTEANYSWTAENTSSGTSSGVDTTDSGVLYTTSGGGDHYIHMTKGTGSIGHTVQTGDVIEVRYRTTNLPSSRVNTTGSFDLWYTTTASDSSFGSSMVYSASVTRLENQWQTVQLTPDVGITLKRLMFDVLEENMGYSGTKLEIDYVYVGPAGNAPSKAASNSLFFDFDGETVDELRYAGAVYGDRNYDTGYWAYNANSVSGVSYGGSAMTVTTVNGATGPYVQTSTGAMGLSSTPLRYTPQAGDMVQIRLKFENMQAVSGQTATAKLYYIKNDGTTGVAGTDVTTIAKLTAADLNGEYVTLTAKLGDTFTSANVINAIRPQFANLTNVSGKTGKIVIDYIYVGGESGLPEAVQTTYTVTFKDEAGNVLDTKTVAQGETAVYGGVTPTKKADSTSHYTFAKRWKNASGTAVSLTNVQSDLTLYPVFTAAAHTREVRNAKEATCVKDGYTGDVYCSVCEHKISTGSVINALGHGKYKYTDNGDGTHKVICGVCDVVVQKSVAHAYAGGTCHCGAVEPTVPTEPEEKNGIVSENGGLYYYVDGKLQYNAGLVKLDGSYYYVRSSGQCATGRYWVTNTNGLMTEGFYTFGTDGKMVISENIKNGIVSENGGLYYYVNGNLQYNAGLVKLNGSYYYVRSSGQCATGKYWVTNTNGLMTEGFYTFGTDGKMITSGSVKNGIVSENGGLYYYVGGNLQYNAGLVKLNGSYYYVRSSGQCATGKYWVTNTNGLMAEGFYTFGTDGKMVTSGSVKNGIVSENGGLYYYVGGNLQYNAGLIYLDGAYYYIRSNGQCAVGQYWVTNTNGLATVGFYTFGTDGKMIR